MTVREAYKYIYSQLSGMQIHVSLDESCNEFSRKDCD